jgi:hypothetical protein
VKIFARLRSFSRESSATESPNFSREDTSRFKLLKKRWLASSRTQLIRDPSSHNSHRAGLALVEGLAVCLVVSFCAMRRLKNEMESLVCHSKEKGIGHRLESGIAG